MCGWAAAGPVRVVSIAFTLAVVACVLAALPAERTKPTAAVPINDNFANAIDLGSTHETGIIGTGNNLAAGVQAGENTPSCQANYAASVWFKWTADSDPAIIDTFGSDFDTVLAIYSGSSFPLTEIGCNDNFGGTNSSRSAIRGRFTYGETYYLQVSGAGGATGNIVLNQSFAMSVVTINDDNTIADTYLTLREAITFASYGTGGGGGLGRSLTGAEAALTLSGSQYPGTLIHFSPAAFPVNSPLFISLGSALPQFGQHGFSVVSGIGAGVVIDGQNLNFDCLTVTSNGAQDENRIEGLEFRRCAGASFPAAVKVTGTNNVIGGTTIPAQRNVFSQNSVAVAVVTPGTDNRIIGNYIGTNAAGSTVSQNALGIILTGANNQIGGSAPGEGNLLGGSTYEQIRILQSTASGNTVRGNQIGGMTGSSGSYGIRIDTQAQGNTVGGPDPGEGNVISNTTFGISIESGPDNVVQGNKIGTNAAGTSAKPNSVGLKIAGSATGITIGGTAAGARNIISGNTNEGLIISNANGNTVQGNYIGTVASGGGALPNGLGIGLYDAAGNMIGGTAPGAGNLISGNTGDGMLIDNSGGNNASPNALLGNTIGSHSGGGVPLPNGAAGVHIQNSAGNQVGSTAAGAGNIIAFNNGGGVRLDNGSPASNGNSIRGNSIFGNVGLGVDLTGGANGGIAAPVITSMGSAHGTACNNCTVDVYSDSEDEGQIFQGTATADASGNWSYLGAVVGPKVTAIATNGSGNSSEFSAAFSCGACNTPTPTGLTPSPTASPSPTPTLSPTTTPVGQTPSPTPNSSDTETPTATGGTSATPTPTGAPSSSETPTPTPVPTASPGGSATPTPTPVSSLVMGDANCDGHVDVDDVVTLLEEAEGLAESCAGAATVHVAIDDVNCDGDTNAMDALDLLRNLASVPDASIPAECPAIGSAL
jgi:hypothetical protein